MPSKPPTPTDPVIYLISGPMAAGKSTVAELLAARFEKGVHLEGDVFRRSVVSGRLNPTPEMAAEAVSQLRMRYQLAAKAADGYFDSGFTVALEDVVAGPLLGEMRTMIHNRPCHVIVLLPSAEAIAARDVQRDQTGYSAWSIEELRESFVRDTPRVGIWIDTSEMTADETVDAILERTSLHTASSVAPIVVTPYNPNWPKVFEQLARPVRAIFSDLEAEIEHVGSTAVRGLRAKPVIDMDVVINSESEFPTAIDRLSTLGYIYQGDKGIPGREAFMWPDGAPRHHLYTVVKHTKPYGDHIDFRDYLRANPHTANEYAQLKDSLALRYPYNRLAYTDAKAEFITEVLRKARTTS